MFSRTFFLTYIKTIYKDKNSQKYQQIQVLQLTKSKDVKSYFCINSNIHNVRRKVYMCLVQRKINGHLFDNYR